MISLIFLSLFPSLIAAFDPSAPFEKFEYKYSFRGPYLSQPDGSIPFWEKYGNALPSEGAVRLTTSLRNQKGAVWTKNKTTFENWEVEFHFRIFGRGRTGGEGLAFWYLNEKPSYSEGSYSIFGGPPGTWQGLGLIWDSFDNDGNFQQPSIIGVLNDQSVRYNYDQDGSGQYFTLIMKEFRNSWFTLKARVRWHNRMLSLHFNNGDISHPKDEDFTPCFYNSDISEAQMPKFGYFGFSASTRVAADNHDIFLVSTKSLHPPEARAQMGTELDPEVREKANKVFAEIAAKAERTQLEYLNQHPDAKQKHDQKAQEEDEEDEELYSDDMGKEYRKIFTEQHDTSRDLILALKRADEVLGKVEHLSGAVGRLGQLGVAAPAPAPSGMPSSGGGGAGAPTIQVQPSASPMQRADMNALLQANRELLQTIKEIKDAAQSVVGSLDRNEFHDYFNLDKGKPQHQGKLEEGNTMVQEVKSEILTLQGEAKDIFNQMKKNEELPCPITCVSTKAYLLISSFFTVVILLILIGKDSQHGNILNLMSTSQRYY